METWSRYLAGYFDGVTSNNTCGSGEYIVLGPGTFYYFCWNYGVSSNNHAKLFLFGGSYTVQNGCPLSLRMFMDTPKCLLIGY